MSVEDNVKTAAEGSDDDTAIEYVSTITSVDANVKTAAEGSDDDTAIEYVSAAIMPVDDGSYYLDPELNLTQYVNCEQKTKPKIVRHPSFYLDEDLAVHSVLVDEGSHYIDPELNLTSYEVNCEQKPKPKIVRRPSFYLDKDLTIHAYYTDFNNNAVTRLIGAELMTKDKMI